MSAVMKPANGSRNGHEALIEVKACRQAYQKRGQAELLVLDGVDVSIHEGEIVGLLGRSGSGKSSLLRIIAGLARPVAGEVKWRGETVMGPPDGLAMVFQSFALFPWLTVMENVLIGLESMEIAAAVAHKRALEAIDLIGLDGFENAYPKELSGGMRQRVGLARALVAHPKLLLMDEPFSALDVLTAETLRTDLIDLWIEGRLPIKSIIIVTHNIEEAVLLCDRILILSSNPGRVASEIKVELQHPRRRTDLPFRQLVDQIYGLMTQRAADEPLRRAPEGFPGTGLGMVLPALSTNLMSGLMEAIAAAPFNGHADLPVLAASLNMPIDKLFPIAETLQLLRFADMAEGDIALSDIGRAFAGGSFDERKLLLADQLLNHVPIVALIKRVLDERPRHRAPFARFRQELEDFMPEEAAVSTLKAVTAWARFAELFAYDEVSAQFNLENPA